MITVLYFARVAELTGQRQEQWPLEHPVSVREWLEQLRVHHPALQPAQALRVAINQYHATHETLIHPGDEVAVFEPVTGG